MPSTITGFRTFVPTSGAFAMPAATTAIPTTPPAQDERVRVAIKAPTDAVITTSKGVRGSPVTLNTKSAIATGMIRTKYEGMKLGLPNVDTGRLPYGLKLWD